VSYITIKSNQMSYRRILKKDLLPTNEKMLSKEELSDVFFFFSQHDNAPAQTAKTTKKWLENKSIRVMFWP